MAGVSTTLQEPATLHKMSPPYHIYIDLQVLCGSDVTFLRTVGWAFKQENRGGHQKGEDNLRQLLTAFPSTLSCKKEIPASRSLGFQKLSSPPSQILLQAKADRCINQKRIYSLLHLNNKCDSDGRSIFTLWTAGLASLSNTISAEVWSLMNRANSNTPVTWY